LSVLAGIFFFEKSAEFRVKVSLMDRCTRQPVSLVRVKEDAKNKKGG
jgi:hypothetical protein